MKPKVHRHAGNTSRYSDDDIIEAVKATDGNARKLAERLGVGPNYLYTRSIKSVRVRRAIKRARVKRQTRQSKESHIRCNTPKSRDKNEKHANVVTGEMEPGREPAPNPCGHCGHGYEAHGTRRRGQGACWHSDGTCGCEAWVEYTGNRRYA
jgi:hypothetical protein